MKTILTVTAVAMVASCASTPDALTAADITQVVAGDHAEIKRACWVPALEHRAEDAPLPVHVMGNFVIAPSGAVTSASATGAEREYPTLAPCIAKRMKAWRFRPSAGTTPVSVPFVFSAQ